MRQEDAREIWRWAALEWLRDDVRFGLRMLRKTWLWTLIVSLTLAMGVGLSTAIFSVVYGVLLQPLPYPHQEKLVAVGLTAAKKEYSRFHVNAALWLYWRANTNLLEDLGLTRPVANFNLTGEGPPERLQGARTSYNVPSVLRVRPLIGRTFTEEEQQSDARVAVLSYAFWKRRFGSDSKIVGRKIRLNGEPFEVIGVMPPEYQYPSHEFELWTPLYIPPDEIIHGMNNQYLCVGRLKPGVSLEQAQAEFSGMMQRLAKQYPLAYGSGNQRLDGLVEPLAQSDAVQIRSTLFILLAAVGCLLLIGCMNLAGLLISRATARAHEIAVRVALGASRARIRRQLLAEIMPLSVGGITGGLLFAWWMLQILIPYLPADTPRAAAIGLHSPVVIFAVSISIAVVLIGGLLPGHIAAGHDPQRALQQGSRSVTGRGRARNILVMGQIAVTLVLLLVGLMFVRSFSALLQVKPGFSMEGVLTMQLAVTRAKYHEDEQVADYYRRIVDRVQSIRGVIAAGVVNRLPFTGLMQTGGIEFEGRPGYYDSDWRSATPGYFNAVGIPLKQGRLLQAYDRARSPLVGLIDERLARKVFGSESPIGKRFRRYLPGLARQDPWTEIVGVVGHILNDNLEQDLRPQVYWPETQRAQDRGGLVVRIAGADPEVYAKSVVEQIRKENPDQPVYDIRTMKQWVGRTLERRTLMTAMAALFAGASLLLACIGLYGVVSYTTTLRVREFGVRLALGATTGSVYALVLRQAGDFAVVGCMVGLALSWPVTRALESVLFGVTNDDIVSWLVAPALLILVALFSCLAPAGRAARTGPAAVLKAE
jgi:putative ABC transport system permease protein